MSHDSIYRGPITLLEPLVLLIGRHGYAREKQIEKASYKVGYWVKMDRIIIIGSKWSAVWWCALTLLTTAKD